MAAAAPNMLLLVVAVLMYATYATSANHCPACGSTPVPYPLSTGTDCGDPSYKIKCDAGALKLDTLNNTYPITSINRNSMRFVIQPSNFTNNTCITQDLRTNGFHMNSSLPFNISSSNTIMYLNCTSLALFTPLNCTSTSLCHTYINGTASATSAGCGSDICCVFRAGGSTASYSINVEGSRCSAYSSFVNLDLDLPVSQWPDEGLEIQWAPPPEPVCGTPGDCGSNSTCGTDPTENRVKRCFCNSGLLWNPIQGVCSHNITCQDPNGCDSSGKIALIAGLSSGLGTTLLLAIIALVWYIPHRKIKEAKKRLAKEREEILNIGGGKTAKLFTEKEMKKATNNFAKDQLLGSGGFGDVYKGFLDDGTVIAVKCAKLGSIKGIEQVLNEVRILCQVNHRSLVGLLGCCVELEQPLLVYKYIPNGTLSDHLRDLNRPHLSWAHRLSIAHTTAEGLTYLHLEAVPTIYHRDVKSSNILLDEKLNAKVADFGISRLAETDLSHISTCAQGTIGYLDPEYYRTYQLTEKSDVYSFGVVLLELLTSQRAVDFTREEDHVNLAIYVQNMVKEERILDVVDPILKERANRLELDTMKALGFLAVACLEEKRKNRPLMKEVTEEIEYIIGVTKSNFGNKKKNIPEGQLPFFLQRKNRILSNTLKKEVLLSKSLSEKLFSINNAFYKNGRSLRVPRNVDYRNL